MLEKTHILKNQGILIIWTYQKIKKLLDALLKTNKPVILILNEGRPRIISSYVERSKGIVQTYLPGNKGGDALALILFGDRNLAENYHTLILCTPVVLSIIIINRLNRQVGYLVITITNLVTIFYFL